MVTICSQVVGVIRGWRNRHGLWFRCGCTRAHRHRRRARGSRWCLPALGSSGGSQQGVPVLALRGGEVLDIRH
jgi:hypothetical protein